MSSSADAKQSADYTANAITVLHGLEAVRKRPGMYIGGTSSTGLHHLVYEVIDNSVDEAMAGHCTQIDVTLNPDGSLAVQDDGRGIPTDINPKEGKSGVELALTVLHAGGKFDKGEDAAYNFAGGLHGVGVSVVNALSDWVRVTVDQKGKRHFMEFRNGGHPVGPLKVLGATKLRGTLFEFHPDASIFTETTEFEYDTIANRLRSTAYLNAGLILTLEDKRPGRERERVTFCAKQGVAEMVRHVNESKGAIHADVLHFAGTQDDVVVEIAIQWNPGYTESLFSYANGVRTPDGGTHETGFRAALTNVVKSFVDALGTTAQKKYPVQGGDLSEGLTAVVAVRLREPQFEGQTKGRLNNSEVRSAVQTFLGERLKEYFEERPKTIRAIIEKVAVAAQGRELARKAREAVREKKSLLDVGTLPGKLADCSSSNPAETEVFIVEGDSAGGSAKQGRNRHFQAILPLRGKILNVEKAKMDRILDSEEIRAIITCLGCGFGEELDLEKLRYHKICLMTDADVDGAHIRTLILTLLFRYFKPVIEGGYVYITQPPLYKVQRGKAVKYAFSDAERDAALIEIGRTESTRVQRYKGLGEMNPEELWETTMDPAVRVLHQVTIDDAAEADIVFSTLMGDEVAPRREWIQSHAKYAKNLDI